MHHVRHFATGGDAQVADRNEPFYSPSDTSKWPLCQLWTLWHQQNVVEWLSKLTEWCLGTSSHAVSGQSLGVKDRRRIQMPLPNVPFNSSEVLGDRCTAERFFLAF